MLQAAEEYLEAEALYKKAGKAKSKTPPRPANRNGDSSIELQKGAVR